MKRCSERKAPTDAGIAGFLAKSLAMALVAAITTPGLVAQNPREGRRAGFEPRFHDPSTPVREGRTWWVFSTGRGISSRWSDDLKTWKEGPPVLREMPAWHKQVVPDHHGDLWAPDVIYQNGLYRIYYSVSSFGKNISAIGLITSPTLDPKSPRCKWKDEGIIVRSGAADRYNAIDPAVFADGNGKLWLAFGSFWNGIQLMELDAETGKAHPGHKDLRRIAWHETIEAPALIKHDRHYYLFVNWGLCCRGLQSTYEIRVGRSQSITGPYLDRNGNDLATGGGTLLIGSEGDQVGPGHASFVTERIDTLMFYHFYDRKRGGTPGLGHVSLRWNKDGWPEATGR